MNIEIFPVEKSCEQGCSSCPLARKDREITATHIDINVQETFSRIERLLKKRSIRYNLHTTSSLHLFPRLRYPELIRMARFETSKEIRLDGNPNHFSENLKALFESHSLDPKILAVSIVPPSPIISSEDVDLVGKVLNELGWYLRPYKQIDVTIRSNLIPWDSFKKHKNMFFENDKKHLKQMIKNEGATIVSYSRKKPEPITLARGKMYFNSYEAQKGSNRITVSNRIIAGRKATDRDDTNIKEAYISSPGKQEYVDIAIAPKGVMLMHSSLAINNPILWMSHADFRDTLQFIAKVRPGFSMKRFVEKLILGNAVFYQLIRRSRKEEVLPAEYFLKSFEVTRKQDQKTFFKMFFNLKSL